MAWFVYASSNSNIFILYGTGIIFALKFVPSKISIAPLSAFHLLDSCIGFIAHQGSSAGYFPLIDIKN
jgi:hypothetical protein